MKNFLKWYIGKWKKKELDGLETIEMCWASVFILLFLSGLFILFCLTFNYITL